MRTRTQRPEASSFYHVRAGDETQLMWLGVRRLYLLVLRRALFTENSTNCLL